MGCLSKMSFSESRIPSLPRSRMPLTTQRRASGPVQARSKTMFLPRVIAGSGEISLSGREISFAEAVSEAIRLAMEKDERIVVIGEDVRIWGGPFGRYKGFVNAFGESRILDAPISE